MEGFDILDPVALHDVAAAAAAGFVLIYGVVLVSGFLPLRGAPFPAPQGLAKALVLIDSGALLLLAGLLAGYIAVGTSWAPALIAAGLAVLAAPPVFQALPRSWAGGLAGLMASLAATATLVAVLAERLFT